MATTLIEHGTVITLDGARRIISDGAVIISDERIESVGPRDQTPRRRVDHVIDATHMVVLPGLIDVHAHAGHALVKSLGSDLGDGWNEACEAIYARGSTPEFWHADGALGALERLKSGVTCGVSLLGGGNSIYRSDDSSAADAHLDALQAAGIRCLLAVGPCPPPYPTRFVKWDDSSAVGRDRSLDEQLATCRQVIERWHGAADGRLRVGVVSPSVHPTRIATPALQAHHDEQARAARQLSRECGVLFTQDGHHRGSVRHAHHTLDLLGPDVLISHATDLDPDEISICADTGTRIAHNPSAIASILGRCPVPELLDLGVTVAIGSDGMGPDRSGDMFRHMQQCMHYHRRHALDPEVLPPGKVLEMVTIDAARALGMEKTVGSIEPGKQADIILVDLRKPHLWPPDMPLYRIAYYANGADVDTVIVNGKVLMRERKVNTMREDAVLDAALREYERAVARSDLEHLRQMPRGLWAGSHF